MGDVKPFDQLSDENKTLLTDFQQQENVKFYHTSNVSQEGIMQMRNDACDQLLLQRVEAKLRGKKTENVLNRLHVAVPENWEGKNIADFVDPEIMSKLEALEKEEE